MLSFFLKWIVNIAALFIVIHTVAGVSAENYRIVVYAALVIGLLNAFLRPVLIMLTLPLTILSLGTFTLIINAFMFYLASKFVIGFTVANLWSAFWASLLFSIISFILNLVLSPKINMRLNMFNTQDSGAGKRKSYNDVIDVEGKVVDESKENPK